MERGTGAEELRQGVREALERGAVVVTANERAARGVRRGWDKWRLEGGAERWEPAAVMTWSAWTASLWRDLLLAGRVQELLLNPFQEHMVWRSVLESDPDATGLRCLDGMAAMAAETWARMCAYSGVETRRGRISARLRDDGSRDTAAFVRWASAFERRCGAERLLTRAELDAMLAASVRRGEVEREEREVSLLGFDRLTPVQDGLLLELRTSGWAVSQPAFEAASGRRMLTAARDEVEELRGCARWAASALKQNPSARLAVVVPDLAAERASIERVFREALAPELQSVMQGEGRAPYEFSLGRSLAEAPLTAVGLNLLRWGLGALPLETVSSLLEAEYFAGAPGEHEARSAFDAFELRRAGMLRPEMTVAGMERVLAGSRRSGKLPVLLGAIRRLARVAEELGGIAQGYGQWAQSFRELLSRAGWGSEGAETSEEFQVRERWESALDALSTLDFEDHAVEYAEALRALERIAKETVFAPESRSAAVQVMGPLEAAGSEFDAIWLLRGGELTWPPETRALPLLSWSYQRELGMPGTDAARDRAAASAMTERLLRSAREVVVSFAEVSDGAKQRASVLVRDIGLEGVAWADLAGAESRRTPVRMERVEDPGCAAPLPERSVTGGVRVLELQAACGFRAFAEQRLWSRELDRRDLGLNARENGTAVHRALEFFWNEVRSQDALLAMSSEEVRATLAWAIDEGLKKAETYSASVWDAAYLAMQRERLRRLLSGWLEMEKARPTFVVKQSEEEMRDVELGPLRLRLRVDRVDLVEERQVLIDYKTGSATPSDWLGERPDSPQVPLYAILSARNAGAAGRLLLTGDEEAPAELGAVAFGSVRAGKGATLRGFAAREGLLPGRLLRSMDASTFEAQVDRWGEVLERLATEFAAGKARVLPKNYPGTCQRCGQRMLCRLDASLLEEVEEDEAEEGEGG